MTGSSAALTESINELPIACAIAPNYLLALLVLLESIQTHLRPSCRVKLYLVHPGLPAEALKVISGMVDLHSIIPPADTITRVPANYRYPQPAAYPLVLAEALPQELDSVLFLDADLLVQDDLALLWEDAEGEELIAAVADEGIRLCGSARGVKQRQKLGVPDAAPYFNAGIIRIHLGQWRQQRVTERALDYLQLVKGEVDFFHQEALNAVLWSDWKSLHRRWNLIASLIGRRYSEPSLRECERPGIVHFAGRCKPWRSLLGGAFASQYATYLQRVARHVEPIAPTLNERLLGFYDRHLRDYCYPAERQLWKWRIL